MKYKQGEYVLIMSRMRFAKIESVRTSGSVLTLWVKSEGNEFPISALKGSNLFVLKRDSYPRESKSEESVVIKANTVVTLIGIFSLLCLILNHFGV